MRLLKARRFTANLTELMKSLMQHAAVNSCAVPIGQVYTILHEFIITRRYDTDIV